MRLKASPSDFVVKEIPRRKFEEQGNFFVYQATKTDLTTHEMIKRLANDNGLSAKQLRYAGNKDRRAVTTQYLTSPQKIVSKDEQVVLEHVGFLNDQLGLGDLEANEFFITAYEVEKTHEVHIPNYFGEQRFSSDNVRVGAQLLTNDFQAAAEHLRGQFRAVDEHLQKKPKDAVSALRQAPLKILLLYVHSVQSYLYNQAVSQYVQDNYTDFVEVTYSQGVLRYPKEPLPDLQVPLVGAVNELGSWEKYYEPLLEELGLGQHNFMVRSFAQLTQEGTNRSLRADVRTQEVELDGSTARVHLILGSGCYATIALKGLLS